MKKNLFLISVAALAFAACTNETTEYVGDTSPASREIAISPLAQKATRATTTTGAIESTTYPDNLDMQVSAYAFSSPADATWSSAVYFGKTTFTGTGDNWVASPKKYWPLTDAYLSFLAVAGVDAADVSMDITNSTTAAYDADSWTAQTDLMYAAQQEHVVKNGNILTFPDDVDMTFHHALALLKFNVRVPSGATYNDQIAVTKIVIKNGVKTGTLTLGYSNYNTVGTPTLTHTWGSYGSATDIEVPNSAKAASLKNDGTYDECGTALVVPKNAVSFDSFVIYYTINGVAYTFEYTPASTVLNQETKYIYNITFTLNEIIIDPEVENWIDGGTNNIDIPSSSFAAATGGTYNVDAAASTYTIYVTGLGGSDAISAAETGGNDYIDGDITATNTSGIAKLVFKMKANDSSARSTTITLTDTTDGSKTTTITISQAAGA
jgi:hypothetical protein